MVMTMSQSSSFLKHHTAYMLILGRYKCFGSHVEDIMFRRHIVGDDKGSRTREEACSGSPNYLLAACCECCMLPIIMLLASVLSSARPPKTWLRSRMDNERFSSLCLSRLSVISVSKRKLKGGLRKSPFCPPKISLNFPSLVLTRISP